MNVLKQFLLIAFIITIISSFSKGEGLKVNLLSNNNKSSEVTKRDSRKVSESLLVVKKDNTSSNIKVPLSLAISDEPVTMLPDGTLWRDKSDMDYLRFGGVAAGILAIDIGGYFKLKNEWYDHPTTKMHAEDFKLDIKLYKQMDKFGHMAHAYFATSLLSRLYRWTGMSGNNSILYSALTGWLWMLQIEIADGFFEEWGFSWGDLSANTIGVSFATLQQLYPKELGGLQLKFSYHTSDALKARRYNNGAKIWIDDYEGLTWWLAVNVYHYLPVKVQQNYPEWLKPFGFAIGQSANDIAADPLHGQREIFLGLDYDFRKLSVGDDIGIIRFLKTELNIIRLPLPAVKITPNGVWYGLYF